MDAPTANYLIGTWSISQTEIDKALAASGLVFADAILQEGYEKIYSIKSNCDNHDGLKCLYLYLYMLQYYKKDTTTSLVPESTMITVLSHIEQISKTCCNGL